MEVPRGEAINCLKHSCGFKLLPACNQIMPINLTGFKETGACIIIGPGNRPSSPCYDNLLPAVGLWLIKKT